MNFREAWYGTVVEKKSLAQRLFGLLASISSAILNILQTKIWLHEPGLAIDDLEDLTARLGDCHDGDLIKIYARPLQYFTSFSRNEGSSSEGMLFQMGGITMQARDLEEIFRIDTPERN